MKNTILKYMASLALIFMAGACEESEIIKYDISNSAVAFQAKSFNFSMKGMTEESRELSIDISLVGPIAEYDRDVDVELITEGIENAAVEGEDFELLDAVVKAGESKGVLRLKVNKLDESTSRKSITLALKTNENFRYLPNETFADGEKMYLSTTVAWSSEYVRPRTVEVWQYWHVYFSRYYSKAIHELYCQLFTEDVEQYTRSPKYASDFGLIYMTPFWWLSASHTLYDYVSEYDKAHPDAPLRHSDDWLYYVNYKIADGEGIKNIDAKNPTIFETLVAL